MFTKFQVKRMNCRESRGGSDDPPLYLRVTFFGDMSFKRKGSE